MIRNEETKRLEAVRKENAPWKKWGPYLSERQWGTVREDYSDSGRRLELLLLMTRRAHGHTAGARTGSPGSPTTNSGSASPLPCGTGRTPS